MPPQPVRPSIREVLLQEIKAQEAQTRTGGSLQQGSLLDAAARKLSGYEHEAILTQWSELFRTGLLAWGMNLSNPNPPFFHLTDRGRQALENATRDPSNPAGYLRHLASMATLNDVAMSYLIEGLDCYVGGLFKAGAVMVGGAAESVILDLRDTAVQKLAALGRPVPKPMEDWRIKTVSDVRPSDPIAVVGDVPAHAPLRSDDHVATRIYGGRRSVFVVYAGSAWVVAAGSAVPMIATTGSKTAGE